MSAARPGDRLVAVLAAPRTAAVVVVLALVAAALVALWPRPETRTATAYFSRAVAVYVGTEVRVLGVPIGEVTAVVPAGDSVRVDLEYDAEHRVPADARAAIVTPTLVADRFVQLTPVWTGGPALADGARIPLADTAVPVELDRIYGSITMLSDALGPDGANRDGSLDDLLTAGARALDGRGVVANRAIRDLSRLAQTLGGSSEDLFATVDRLDAFTQTLAADDRVVDAFLGDLSRASAQLSGERQEIAAVLDALSSAVGTVRRFVRDNREAATGEVEKLTTVLGELVKEKESLATALEVGPLGAGNLALGFDTSTGSQNARIQIGPNVEDLDGFLCSIVSNAGVRGAPAVCTLLERLIEPLGLRLPDVGARATPGPGRPPGSVPPAESLLQLLEGVR